MTNRVKGVDKVLENLAREIAGIESRTMAGLLAAAYHIQGVSRSNAPYDTGTLRASAYTEPRHNSVEIGYSAEYAAAVHENMEANFRRGGPKFLERAVAENTGLIVDLVRQHARAS